MYRSVNSDYMGELKDAVKQVTKGCELEDRKFSVQYLKNHVRLDDLQKKAAATFPGKTFMMGTGSYLPKLVVVSKNPLTPPQKEKLDQLWKKFELTENDLYFAHLHFVSTKQKEEREKLVAKLLNILAPKLILVFDHLKVSSGVDAQMTADEIVAPEAKEKRKALPRLVRHVIAD